MWRLVSHVDSKLFGEAFMRSIARRSAWMWLFLAEAAFANQSALATLSVGGSTNSSFCTRTGHITVVLACQNADPANFSSCGFGYATLAGPGGTYYLGAGAAFIVPGCYSHIVGGTSVSGSAVAASTVWY